MFSLAITSILGSAAGLASLSEPTLLIALGLVLFGTARALRARAEQHVQQPTC
jgi:hypothetical protein